VSDRAGARREHPYWTLAALDVCGRGRPRPAFDPLRFTNLTNHRDWVTETKPHGAKGPGPEGRQARPPRTSISPGRKPWVDR
jgi:hypothetical protein